LDWKIEKGDIQENPEIITPVSTDPGASNSWVVHGKHTETGMPMLANDPHLANAMPAFWQL
jgi:penicillin G amidase